MFALSCKQVSPVIVLNRILQNSSKNIYAQGITHICTNRLQQQYRMMILFFGVPSIVMLRLTGQCF